MEEETKQLLKNDELPGSFKQEDASMSSVVSAVANFEEGWILRKYKGELKDRNSAAFVYLIQHIFALVWKMYSGPATIQLPLDENSMGLLKRDIGLLKHILQKDQATTMMFLILFFDKMQQDVSDPTKPDLNTPSELRKYLSVAHAQLISNFTTKLEDYNCLRSSVMGETTEHRLQVLNYINGNHTAESMQLLYPELILPTIWLKPAQVFEERHIEEFLRLETEKNIKAAFILDLLDKRNYLSKIRSILVSIKEFAKLLGKRFDRRFSRAESLAFQSVLTQENTEPLYKLNLASILNNSYFKSLKSTISQPTDLANAQGSIGGSKACEYEVEAESNYEPEDIKKEFAGFCKMLKEHLNPLIASVREDIETRLKLDCRDAPEIIQALTNLGNPIQSPLVSYCFPNTAGLQVFDPPLVLLKSLVEALLSIQLELISRYRDDVSIVPFMPRLPQTPRLFLECSEEHFIHLDSQKMMEDLKVAAYWESHPGTNNTRIAIDTQIVAKKWADILFSEAERISVTFNLNFVDQKDNNLFELCNRLSKERNIQMETYLVYLL